jgi:stage V sporulation protein AD
MDTKHRGRQSVVFPNRPVVLSSAAVVGKKEGEGPLAKWFDRVEQDTKFGQESWEKAESRLQSLTLQTALDKASLSATDLDFIFAGDLLNQCIGSSFSLRGTGIPFLGLYGACSTMVESLTMAALTVDGGYAGRVAALTSSHFASAERQYRLPLVYGGQRTPTAQWTVTGSGCAIVAADGDGPHITAATVGRIADKGIKDANNMGAAMAPAAYLTLTQHFEDFGTSPSDYDIIVTGDLGTLGRELLLELFQKDGVDLQRCHNDCGCMIFDIEGQDVHAGGSGCGCCGSVLCGHLLPRLASGELKKILVCATGALLSPTSTQQGESIPAIAHAVVLEGR